MNVWRTRARTGGARRGQTCWGTTTATAGGAGMGDTGGPRGRGSCRLLRRGRDGGDSATAISVLRDADSQGRYHRQQPTQAVDRDATVRRRGVPAAQVRRRQRDEASDPRLQPDDTGPPELWLGGDLSQRQAQPVERMGGIRDRDRRARKDRAANRGSLLGLL